MYLERSSDSYRVSQMTWDHRLQTPLSGMHERGEKKKKEKKKKSFLKQNGQVLSYYYV